MPGSAAAEGELLARLRELIDDARLATEQSALTEPVPATAPLAGYLDSMAVAVLVGLIEDEWEIELEDEEIGPENFADLRSLSTLIEHKRSERR